ncbi:MAG: DUF3575 domain-containing protein [Bacteroides sp.]|nr:DUF3575 domain-containing protein [Bacteroides sp.]
MKMKILRTVVVALLAFFVNTGLVAGENESSLRADTITKEVHFRLGKHLIEPGFKNNKAVLDSLVSLIDSTGLYLKDISIIGAASPEGGAEYNMNLSHKRSQAVADYLLRHTDIRESEITHSELGRDWPGLEKYVAEDPDVPAREEVLSLLTEISGHPDESSMPDKMELLKRIDNGRAYKYLYARYFAPLRATRISLYPFNFPTLKALELSPIELASSTARSEIIPIEPLPSPKHKPFYMALKTNMLLDAALIPSIGAEFYVGKNISLVANWAYGWWDTNHRHRYWRYYGGDIAIRWWFGKAAHAKPLTGHHLGLYGGILTFDFEFGGKGIMGGRPHHSLWDRSLANAGIEYGYSLPVARRLNIDFTIGIGYLGGHYVKYHPEGKTYVWDSLNKLTWVGPTKAEISLVWLIGNDNYNRR